MLANKLERDVPDAVEVITSPSYDEAGLNAALAQIWTDLQRHPEALPEALSGVDLAGDPPFTAVQKEGQIGVAETLLIAFATQMTKELATTLWKSLIWPRLQQMRPGVAAADDKDASDKI